MESKFGQKFDLNRQAHHSNLKQSGHRGTSQVISKSPNESADKTVMDIMYQMLYDESKFKLRDRHLSKPEEQDLLRKTRAQLLEQISRDLATAAHMHQQPDFRLKEMQDLLEGRDLKPDALAATGTLQEGNADLLGAGQIAGE